MVATLDGLGLTKKAITSSPTYGERCLREVASVAGLETEILSYDKFCDSFLVTV
jgi:hypothetical protein